MDLKKFEFSSTLLFFWIKNSLEIDENIVSSTHRNTFLKIFPAGPRKRNFPVGQIATTYVNTKYDIKSMIIGLLITIFLFWTVIGLFVGLIIVFESIKTTICIESTGGKTTRFRIPFYNKKIALESCDYINDMIVLYQENRNVSRINREISSKEQEAADSRNEALLNALNNNGK